MEEFWDDAKQFGVGLLKMVGWAWCAIGWTLCAINAVAFLAFWVLLALLVLRLIFG